MEGYHVCRILRESTSNKQVSILYAKDIVAPSLAAIEEYLAKSPDSMMIKRYEKSQFVLPIVDIDLKLIQENDVYSNFTSSSQDVFKLDIIRPCTLQHIYKHLEQKSAIVSESAAEYQHVSRPWIEAIPENQTKWILQVLNGASEQEDVMFSNNHFILLPDAKWDRVSIANMYLLAISRLPIRSIRDLNHTHLPLLESIGTETKRLAMEKYGVESSQLRMYVHYHPSYYHFHVHAVHLSMEVTMGMVCGKACGLEDIIESIKIKSDFYLQRTISFQMSENHPLFKLLKESKLPKE